MFVAAGPCSVSLGAERDLRFHPSQALFQEGCSFAKRSGNDSHRKMIG